MNLSFEKNAPIVFEQNIPVYYFMFMQKLQAQDHTGSIETIIGKTTAEGKTAN